MVSRARLRLPHRAVAALLGLLYVVLLLRTTSDLGYARDEGFYFQAAETYGAWLDQLVHAPGQALTQAATDRAFRTNSEHPSLMKLLFAASHEGLHRGLGLFAMEGTSFRFPGMVMGGLAIALTYLWGARVRGAAAGLLAAFALAMMPRFFYHAHLACFDVPIVAVWSLVVFAYHGALQRRGWVGPVLTGLAFGLALDTKHNSWFLPFVLGAHALLLAVRDLARDKRLGDAPKQALRSLLAMAALGPPVCLALWPWLWHDTLNRVRGYAAFHLGHEYYNMEFLGRNYWQPPMPRAYAWLMTAATVPTVTLALFAVGLVICARKRLRVFRNGALGDPTETHALWALAIGASYAAWLSPGTPIFGGTKHWMTAYPFLCLFAGEGFARLVLVARRELRLLAKRAGSTLARRARGPLVEVTLAFAVLVAPVVETARSHPWGLASYTPLVGGASGAAALGLNRSFWGYTTGAVVDYLNREVPKGGRVYIHDTAGQAWDMLVRDGRVRRDISVVSSASAADFALYHHEQHMLGQEYQAWVAYGTVRPDHLAGLDGTPVIWVYRRVR